MAAPHVAGAAALVLEASPGANPGQVGSALEGNATTGAVSDLAGSPDRLLYTAP
jgi:subtilisin family serine protease